MTTPTREEIERLLHDLDWLADGTRSIDGRRNHVAAVSCHAAAALRHYASQPGGALAQDDGAEIPPDLAAELQIAMRSYHAELMVMARVVMKKRGQTPILPPAPPPQPEATRLSV